MTEFTATDRYEDFTTAVNALNGALGLAAPGTSRILVIVSDGRCKGTQHAGGKKLITRLAQSGCQVIWIAPSDTATTMKGARVVIYWGHTSWPAPGRALPSASFPRERVCQVNGVTSLSSVTCVPR